MFVLMRNLFALTVLGILGIATAVRADINPNFDSTTANGANTNWNYTINVTAGQEIISGDFFTIYDFGNFIPASNFQPSGWTFASSLTGATPPGVNPSIDNSTIANLTWTYNGPTIPTETFGIGLFGVTINGANTQSRNSFFAGWGTRTTGDQAGTNIANAGSIIVPAQVPEPPTMALIFATGGLAVVGRAFFARFRRS
jgi:hypothetical protein